MATTRPARSRSTAGGHMDGDQKWLLPDKLDYTPTRRATNLIRKPINTRARFVRTQAVL